MVGGGRTHEEWEKEGREWRETKDRRKKEREKKREERKYRERYVMAVSVHVHIVKYTRTQPRIGPVIRNTWYRRITQSWAGLCLTASISPSPPTYLHHPWTRLYPSRAFLPFFHPCAPRHFEPFLRHAISRATPWHTSKRACTTFGSLCTAVSLPSPPYFSAPRPRRLKARLDLTISEGYYKRTTNAWYAKICMCDFVVIRICCYQNIHAIHILYN